MNDSNKKVLLAFGLSFLILVLWRFVFPPPPPVEPPPAQNPTPVQTPGPTSKPAAPTSPGAAKPAAKAPAPVALAVQQGSQAEEIVVENSLARITFSTEGAVVKSWVLKKFRNSFRLGLDRPRSGSFPASCGNLCSRQFRRYQTLSRNRPCL